MEFFKQYLRIINYAMMGLVFVFAGFYLLSNAYHYLEIRKDLVLDFDSQPLVKNIEEKVEKIDSKLSSFSIDNYHGTISKNQMQLIYFNLKACVESFQNETMQSMKNKKKLTIIDVYQLRESYENNILSNCIVNNLYWLTTISPETFPSLYLLNNQNMIQLYINTLLDETTYLKKDLLNNSSYFYNTSIASSSVKDNTRDGFYEVMGAYNKAISFVEFVSDWFNNEFGGQL